MKENSPTMNTSTNPDFLRQLCSSNEEYEFALFVNSEFKNNYRRDPSRYQVWSDIYRARWILRNNPDKDPVRTLKAYNVSSEAAQIVIGERVDFEPEKRLRRQDKYQRIIDWCLENHLVQTDAQSIAELGEISYPTALKFIKDRPDLFYKLKKGLYEVRNPKIVRKEEKLLDNA
jgi:hypothetical protein